MILVAKDIKKQYTSRKGVKTVALDGISFEVKQDEMVAIMGSSGSGKTTLIHALTGLLDLDCGQLHISGNDLTKMTKDQSALFRRKNIGIVFQNYNLLDSLTVEENIRVPLILDNEEKYYMEKEIQKVACIMGLDGVLEKYPYELSGGQQQRVGICRAIVNKAKLIFADEPTGNLDSKSTKTVMEYFCIVNKEYGTSVLMVTHDAVSASFCDRVIYLQDGRIVTDIKRNGSQSDFYEEILETQKEYIK